LRTFINQLRESLTQIRTELGRIREQGRTDTNEVANVAATITYIIGRVFGYAVLRPDVLDAITGRIADRIDDNYVSEVTRTNYQQQLISENQIGTINSREKD
jgi:hypothetical protein